jgi:serine/threonine protein kinase
MSSIISDRYRLLKQLHAATHSQILIAKHRQSDTEVVIKVFEDGAANMCPKEVELLKKCEHPGIVPVFDAFPDTQTGWYCLVMPMVGRRAVDLFDYIEEYGPLQEEVIVTIFKQLLSAIIYLHKDQSVAHCDIKVCVFYIFLCISHDYFFK